MKLHIKRLCLTAQITLCLGLISGCSLWPSAPVVNLEQVDAENDLKETSELLSAELRDFQTLKPSITRLVALESDLTFLLDEVSRFSENNPVMFDQQTNEMDDQMLKVQEDFVVYKADGSVTRNNGGNEADALSSGDAAQSPEIDSFDSIQDAENRQLAAFDSVNKVENALRLSDKQAISVSGDVNKFANTNKMANTVEVNRAKPILRPDGNAKSSKFSKSARPILSAIPRPNSIVGEVPTNTRNKFSSPAKKSFADSTGCASQRAGTEQSFALHLASYKILDNAKNGWQKLLKKYESTWCGATAKLEKVKVKGVDYFSLRVGGYESKEMANDACSAVRELGGYCQVAAFSGERI